MCGRELGGKGGGGLERSVLVCMCHVWVIVYVCVCACACVCARVCACKYEMAGCNGLKCGLLLCMRPARMVKFSVCGTVKRACAFVCKQVHMCVSGCVGVWVCGCVSESVCARACVCGVC